MRNPDKHLHGSLHQGSLCLTATNRLTRQMIAEFDQQMIRSGISVWHRPQVYSLDNWCQQQAGHLGIAGQLLNKAQSLFLWEKVIREDIANTGHELLQVAPTARKAQQAAKLLHEFDVTLLGSDASADHRAFRRWHKAWLAELEKVDRIDPANLINVISEALTANKIVPPDHIVIAGFDDFNPARSRLLNALRQSGSTVEIANVGLIDSKCEKLTVSDPATEVATCARWVRKILQSEPPARIGIVAPQLESYQSLVMHHFHAELDPAGMLRGDGQSLPFNISLSRRLMDEGVVYSALQLLCLSQSVSMDALSWLLRCPHIASGNARAGHRGIVDAKLRERGIARFPLWRIKRLLSDAGCDDSFIAVIDALIKLKKEGRKLLPGVWADKFGMTLQNCGWPGDRSVSSREYQAVERLRSLLVEMASLDVLSEPLDLLEATAFLRRLAGEVEFQPESSDSPVQILGLLEAGGLQFDYLWVVGMHAAALPEPIRPNPFIPLEVQKKTGMPHADADRELEYAEQIIHRLSGSAPHVIHSWPQTEEGVDYRPSPFIRDLPDSDFSDSTSMAPQEIISRDRIDLERLSDNLASPLVSNKPVQGGTAIVKEQALCPFRAFAHYRLKVRGLEVPDIGVDNMVRGTLVHSTLEFFWDETGTHEQLCRMTTDELRGRLQSAAEKAVSRQEGKNRSDLPPLTRGLEVKRLVSLCELWLDLEVARAPFEVVEQEQLHQKTIGRLHFRTRIDRIDRLKDGTLAIIDYKTGLPDPTQWFDERISEPQLPIYCYGLDNADIGAVLFAVVRNGARNCRFSGIARQTADFPRLNNNTLQRLLEEQGWDSIDQVLDSWKLVLPALADAFVRGDAAVDPIDSDKSCRYCDLMTLCRIHEADDWPVGREVNDD